MTRFVEGGRLQVEVVKPYVEWMENSYELGISTRSQILLYPLILSITLLYYNIRAYMKKFEPSPY